MPTRSRAGLRHFRASAGTERRWQRAAPQQDLRLARKPANRNWRKRQRSRRSRHRISCNVAWRPPPGGKLTPSPFAEAAAARDRKSTRLNSSHVEISYAVFCLKKKKKKKYSYVHLKKKKKKKKKNITKKVV